MLHAVLAVVLGAVPGRAAHSPVVAEMTPAGLVFVIQAPADPVLVDWQFLNGLNLDTGKVPAGLQALDGKVVKIASFIVPLEDDMQEADEFLLVPYFGACVHTPPPPANQMIYVKMPEHKTVKIGWWDAVMFVGTLHIRKTDSPYGATSFEMEGISSTPYKAPAKP